jgi:hypothetical protein
MGNYPIAPYLTDNNSDVDLSQYDFVVASLLDGLTESLKFNIWVDKAYRANKPIFGVVKIDPSYYSKNTLGIWFPPAQDKIFNILRKRLIAPDGKTKYKVDAILIDTRTYYYGTQLIGGNWVIGVAEHIREFIRSLGFRTFLLTDANASILYPNGSENPGVALTNEKLPVAVYQKGNPARDKLIIPWASSAFLWWYGNSVINSVNTPMFVSLVDMDKLRKMLGLPSGTTVPDPIIPPTTNPTEIGQKLDLINSKLDVIISKLSGG